MSTNNNKVDNYQLLEGFKTKYSGPQVVVKAPGRVNIIGEHTDYNDGFVMPVAIDRFTWIAARSRTDSRVKLTSLDFVNTIEFDLQDIRKDKEGWGEYFKAVAWILEEKGYPLKGFEGVVTGNVPIGAGLSSSAALELALCKMFAEVSNFDWVPPEMAKLSQEAENRWVGVNCGIMDQMISACGKENQALLIDCKDLSMQTAPLPKGTSIVVMDTSTRRGLVDSAYNERRQQCEDAAKFFGVKTLREVDINQLEEVKDKLSELVYQRAKHVISENNRVLEAFKAMKNNDSETLGQLMNESHESLRYDFEVCNSALNTIVGIAQKQTGCLGARMTGAGFGGCAVALIKSDSAEKFVQEVSKDYHEKTKLDAKIYVCKISDGAQTISKE
jgi:galactokinase